MVASLYCFEEILTAASVVQAAKGEFGAVLETAGDGFPVGTVVKEWCKNGGTAELRSICQM